MLGDRGVDLKRNRE